MSSPATHSDTDYRAQYRELVREIEDKEAKWAKREQAQQRATLRLAFAFGGNDPAIDERLDDFRAQLKQAAGTEVRQRLLDELVEFISATTRTPASTSNENDDWFGELLENLTATLGAIPDTLADQARQGAWAEAISGLGQCIDTALAQGQESAARETMLELLNWLPVQSGQEQRLEALKIAIESADAGTLREHARAVGELVREIQQRADEELRRVESFLGRVSSRLGGLEQELVVTSSSHDRAIDNMQNLDSDVRNAMSAMQDSVGEATTLEAARGAVADRIDRIESALHEFLEMERSRHHETRQQLEEMRNRLDQAGGETKKLQAAVAKERAKATTDALTQVPNRAAFDLRIVDELVQAKRDGKPLSMVVIDLDRFKAINDTYGHQAGDKLLASTASLCRQQLRRADFFARFGGEEFVALMPNTAPEEARARADALRIAVADCKFHFQGQPVPVTLSAGIACLQTDDDQDALFRRADSALYRAKRAGRNRVETA